MIGRTEKTDERVDGVGWDEMSDDGQWQLGVATATDRFKFKRFFSCFVFDRVRWLGRVEFAAQVFYLYSRGKVG